MVGEPCGLQRRGNTTVRAAEIEDRMKKRRTRVSTAHRAAKEQRCRDIRATLNELKAAQREHPTEQRLVAINRCEQKLIDEKCFQHPLDGPSD